VRKYLEDDVFKLYQLIWQRFVASQMLPAVYDQTTIDINAGDYTFRTTGSIMKFDGFLKVYQIPVAGADREDDEKDDEGEGKALPRVTRGADLETGIHQAGAAFYGAAAAVYRSHAGEGAGRGRHRAAFDVCFDYSTIVEREYVKKDQGRFTPTMLGERVCVLLIKSFEDVFDVKFTARLEEELDEIEEGKLPCGSP